MPLDVVIPGISFDLTPDGAQLFWAAFFVAVIVLTAAAAPKGEDGPKDGKR